jgi:hypothetical protein
MADFNEFERGLNTKEAARYLGLSPGSLAVWRSRGVGPECAYSGTKPVYYLSGLKAWQARCRAARNVASASQADVTGPEVIESKGTDSKSSKMVGI